MNSKVEKRKPYVKPAIVREVEAGMSEALYASIAEQRLARLLRAVRVLVALKARDGVGDLQHELERYDSGQF